MLSRRQRRSKRIQALAQEQEQEHNALDYAIQAVQILKRENELLRSHLEMVRKTLEIDFEVSLPLKVSAVCPICWVGDGEEWFVLPGCGHAFCSCIHGVKQKICPVCRQAFDTPKRIYFSS
jgi:hypothetical protein